MPWKEIAELVSGLSHADIVRICDESTKDAIIDGREEINKDDIIKNIRRISFAAEHDALRENKQ